MGISDDKGKLLYSEQVVAEQIGANPEMAKMFYEAQYDMMLQQLSKSNNSYFNTSDPDAMSKAWVVYSRFGPETLTQYVNLTQFFDPNLSEEQQLPQAKNALLALRSVRKEGQTVFKAVDDWFTQNGPADYTGIIRSAELQQKGPLDLNGYTSYIHMAKDTRTGIEKLVTDLSAAAGPTTMGSIWASLTGETPKSAAETANIVAADLQAGTLSKDSKGFYLDILRQAQKEDSTFGMEDIFNTIISHSKPVAGEGGRYKYSFKYEDLPDQAKIAVNTLRVNDNQYQNMVIKQADGSYIFEPGRFDRLADKFAGWGAVITESHPSWNPDGTYAGMKEIPSTGVFAQIANAGSAFVFESGQFAVDYLLAPGLRATGAAAGAFGLEQLEQATEVGAASEWMRDFQDKNLLEQVDGMGVKATVYGTEMALYMAAMYATGGMASAGLARTGISAARYLETASAGRKAHQLYDAGRILAAPTTTRLGAMTQKFATGVETNAAWAVPLRFELGGAGLELLGGQEKSIYNGGLVDSALEAITGGQFDTEKAYLVSDRITQFGVDALTGFGLGNVFDNIWAASKFGTNVIRRRGGRGLAMGADGYYETVAKPVFGPDWRRFMYNVSDGLQEIPIGTFEDSIKNQFNGRMIGYAADNIETVNDVALNFHHQTGEIYETLMQDITNSIRYYDAKLGKTAMSDDQVAERAEQIYKGAMQDLSDSMLGVLKGGDNTNANRFAWRFLDALDEQGPVVKQVSETKQGIESTTFDLATAVRLRAAQPNRVIKSAGDNLYTVHEVDMNFWSVDLARNLREGLTGKQSADEFVKRSMRQAGFDPEAPSAEAEKLLMELDEIAPHMAGRPFLTRAGGKSSLGYVESYDGKAFYIRDSETGELRKMLDNEVLDFVARKGRAPRNIAGLLPEQGSQRGREVTPSSGQPIVMGGMDRTGARVETFENPDPIIGVSARMGPGNAEAYKNSLYAQLRERVAQVGPEITLDGEGFRRVTNLDGTDLFNIAQLRRMGATEKEIYETLFSDQLDELDVLKRKLEEVKSRKVSTEESTVSSKVPEVKDKSGVDDLFAGAKESLQREQALRDRLSAMSFDELEETLRNAEKLNTKLDYNAILKFVGKKEADAYLAMSPKARDKWWNKNATTEMDAEGSAGRGINEDTVREFVNAHTDFDVESPILLGRSLLKHAKGIGKPDFQNTPGFVTIREGIQFAADQGWDVGEVIESLKNAASVRFKDADTLESMYPALFSKNFDARGSQPQGAQIAGELDSPTPKEKLAETKEKAYASVANKQRRVNELNAKIAAKQEELADLQAYSDVLISQTNQMVAQEIPKKVEKAKKAAKKVEEIKNDSPAVKETLNPEDCAPGTIKTVPRSSVPKKPS